MPNEQWLFYALAAMLLFSAANVVLKVLTSRKEAASLDVQVVMGIAAIVIVIAAIAYYSGVLKISGSTLQLLLLFIALSGAGFALMLRAYEDGKVAIITAVLSISTVAVAALSYAFLGDRFSQKELLAMVLAIGSVIALVI